MLRSILTVVFLISMVGRMYAQRPNANYITEIVIGKQADDGKLKVTDRFIQNQNVELDYEETFYVSITRSDLADPFEPIPFGAVVKDIEIITEFDEKIFPPKKISQTCGIVPSRVPLKVKDIVDSSVKDKINTSNISKLNLTIRVNWLLPSEVSLPCAMLYPSDLTEKRIDVFNITVKHFGFLFLLDFNTIAEKSGGKLLDVASGLIQNLSYSSIDYAAVINEGDFSNIILTAPAIRVEGRNWLNRNLEGQVVVVRQTAESDSFIGYGFGLGFLGETKVLKGGVFWLDDNKDPQIFLGLSLVGLSKVILSKN